ncbi:NUMOD4 domain-containing protein [Pseudomonas oryzihabitans]|uniref:NUMOD4 domain-containing protein n=1 Tax=Pseudomonas oryzihabitans TaxID=47885 RepID=UPI0028A007C1|nr:NUMOD4 domain-containing protein [Pseudomonas oryzihabitans]
MSEVWKTVEGWSNYAISSKGRVKRLTTKCSGVAGLVLSQFRVSGYPSVNLTEGKRRKSARVHRLVAEAFISRPEGSTEVNHIDASRDNNDVRNLEWVTSSGNREHGYRHGACDAKGERNGHSKLTAAGVTEIRSYGDMPPTTQEELAEKLGVSKATIRDVFARRTWVHV